LGIFLRQGVGELDYDQCGEILWNFGIFEIVAFVVTPTNFGVAWIAG